MTLATFHCNLYTFSKFRQSNVYARLCLIFWRSNQGNSCRGV